MWVLTLLLIYGIGAIAGWIIEVIYRSSNAKRLVNPGFLNGPYLPMYGAGTVFLFLISSLETDFLIKVVLFIVGTTGLELVTGIIFTEYFNIKLWDYSNQPLNFRGLICLKFSAFWAILSIIFYLLVFPFIENITELYQDHIWTSLFVGFFYGVFLTDVYSQFSLAFKIRKAVKRFNREYLVKFRMDMKQLRRELRHHLKDNRIANSLERYFIPFNRISQTDLLDRFEDQLGSYLDEIDDGMRKRGKEIKKRIREDLKKFEKRMK